MSDETKQGKDLGCNALLGDLRAMINDPRIKIGWYQQETLKSAITEIETLLADKYRLDYMEKFGVDWDCQEEHYNAGAGLFYKKTLRQCCDAAMKARLPPNAQGQGKTGHD